MNKLNVLKKELKNQNKLKCTSCYSFANKVFESSDQYIFRCKTCKKEHVIDFALDKVQLNGETVDSHYFVF